MNAVAVGQGAVVLIRMRRSIPSLTAKDRGKTNLTDSNRRRVPEGFLWGTAISAYQSEGNNINADAWLCEHVKPTAYIDPSLDACDSVLRLENETMLFSPVSARRFAIVNGSEINTIPPPRRRKVADNSISSVLRWLTTRADPCVGRPYAYGMK